MALHLNEIRVNKINETTFPTSFGVADQVLTLGDDSGNLAYEEEQVVEVPSGTFIAPSGATFGNEGTTVSPNQQINGLLGTSVSISPEGDFVAAGAPCEDIVSDEGRVYIYKNLAPLTLHSTIEATTTTNSNTGTAVSLSTNANRIAIGASGYNGTGAVFILSRDDATWTPEQTIEPAGLAAGAQFGSSLQMTADGTRVVIGGGTNNTDVYVYKRTPGATVWALEQKILGGGPLEFGRSVVISDSGAVLAIGDVKYTAAQSNQGRVKTYVRSGQVWSPLFTIDTPTPKNEGHFGSSIAISRDAIFLAIGELDASASDNGNVYIYENVGSDWILHTTLVPTAASLRFGNALAFNQDGNTLVVTHDTNLTFHIYKSRGETYERVQNISPITPEATTSIAISGGGNYIILGDALKNIAANTDAGRIHDYNDGGNLYMVGTETLVVGAAGGASALPNPLAYLQIELNGRSLKLPIFNP